MYSFIEHISLHSFLLIYHPIESRIIRSSCSWAVISLNKWDDILPNENYQNFITRICKNIYLLSNYANPVCKASDCILHPFLAKNIHSIHSINNVHISRYINNKIQISLKLNLGKRVVIFKVLTMVFIYNDFSSYNRWCCIYVEFCVSLGY